MNFLGEEYERLLEIYSIGLDDMFSVGRVSVARIGRWLGILCVEFDVEIW